MVLEYVGVTPAGNYNDHYVQYPDGSKGTRTHEGFTYRNVATRLDTDHDIVNIVKIVPKIKIKSKGHQLFNVPNNEEGREFIRLMRKFNNKKRFDLKGRGSRLVFAKATNAYTAQCSLRKSYSEWFAVYTRKH
jgi:23S rRNA C2498 (ribose-2'-O)-methylase RlmM